MNLFLSLYDFITFFYILAWRISMSSWYICTFLCCLSSQIWGLVLRGDAKTLTSSPWTPLRTWSTDHCTDRSTDPPKKTIIKMTIRNSTYRLFCFLLMLPPSLWRWREDPRTSKETGFSCEPARWSCDICQWMPDFDSCQFILIWRPQERIFILSWLRM